MVDKPSDIDRLYNTVGYVVVHWALMEQSLDACITIIYHYCDGKTLIAPELPFSLSNKREFLKSSFKNIPVLSAFKKEGLLMVNKVDEMSLNAIEKRWEPWVEGLPEPTEEMMEKGRKFIAADEERRLRAVFNGN